MQYPFWWKKVWQMSFSKSSAFSILSSFIRRSTTSQFTSCRSGIPYCIIFKIALRISSSDILSLSLALWSDTSTNLLPDTYFEQVGSYSSPFWLLTHVLTFFDDLCIPRSPACLFTASFSMFSSVVIRLTKLGSKPVVHLSICCCCGILIIWMGFVFLLHQCSQFHAADLLYCYYHLYVLVFFNLK